MSLCTLPNELLLQIFAYLSSRGLICILKTTKLFRQLCDSEDLWKSLCFRRWRVWNVNSQSYLPNFKWKTLYIQRHIKDRELISIVESLPFIKVTSERLEQEQKIISFGKEGFERMRKIQFETCPHDSLTKKYYAQKICKQFIHLECLERWKCHLELPEEQRKLEDGAIIIAQTLGYPRLDPKTVHQQLDSIAEGALRRIGEEMNQERCFEAFNKFFFQELGFKGFDSEGFYPSKSHIHHVLQNKRGIQISLSLVYCAVARRLSLPIKMIGMPRHFLTRYDGDGKYNNHFIDVFNGGQILSLEDLEKRSYPSRYATVNNSQEVYARLFRNLIEEYNGTGHVDNMLTALNQSIYILPQQEELAYRIVIYTNYLGDISKAKQDLELLTSLGSITANGEMMLRNKIKDAEEKQIQEIQDSSTEIKTKMRDENILYSVGHVFRHIRNGYRGVIYGWHETCPEEGQILLASGEEVTNLGSNQPFYVVLIDTRDRSQQTAVVSQQNILLEPGDVIEHPEIGYYFTAFRTGNYIPNDMLRKEYPLDIFSSTQLTLQQPQQSNGVKRTASTLD